MKKSTILCLFLFISTIINAQTIHHKSYTTYYNPVLRIADSVSWDLTPTMVSCGRHTRKDLFAQDPDIPGSSVPEDYAVNSKANKKYQIDKGHLFNYEDAACDSIDKIECFYMSNMLPQYHSFNAGDWKTLETQERKWAKVKSIHIIAGGLGTQGRLPAGENIPAYMWKAIFVNGYWRAWIMPNNIASKGHKYMYWEISLSLLNESTGLKLY